VERIIKSLPSASKLAFERFVRDATSEAQLVQIVIFLAQASDTGETAMLRSLAITKWQRSNGIVRLGQLLLEFLGKDTEQSQLQMTYQLARYQVMQAEYESALDLIKDGLKLAQQSEDFDMGLRFWGLLEPFPDPPKLNAWDKRTIRQGRSLCIAYDDLWQALEETMVIQDAEAHISALESIRDSPLLQAPSPGISQRALYWFWKIKAKNFIILRQGGDALQAQEHLLAHIETHPWVCLDSHFSIAKEMKVLGQLYRHEKKESLFLALSDQFEQRVFENARAEQEKAYLKYPTSIVLAIGVGDKINGSLATSAFLEIFESSSTLYSSKFYSENLYYCAYLYIATDQPIEATKILAQLRKRYGRADFKPRILPMSRFLEIVLAIDSEEWDTATAHLKNLSQGTGLETLPGIRPILLFLAGLIRQWPTQGDRRIIPQQIQKLQETLHGQDVLDYFDIFTWLEARATGRPMIELFRHRASQQP
jgi:hypothetical protein